MADTVAAEHHQPDAGDLSAGRGFFGHPPGLAYLSFAYTFERFAFYGMQTLMVLYMLHQLLTPAHEPNVWGLATLRRAMSGGAGMSDQAFASGLYGLYIGLCYGTPLIGGYLADRFLGRTRTIITGAVILVLGHFLMTFDQSFLIALAMLLIGVGFMKGNVATQVGTLYAPDDLRRSDAFQIFVGIFQLAGVVSPLVCGTLGEKVGFHYGFAAAGIAMAIGLAVYLVARPKLPPDPPRRRTGGEKRSPMTADERKTLLLLLLMVPVISLCAVPNDEIYNAYIVWGARSFQRTFFGFEAPASWLGSLDTAVAFTVSILVIIFWRWHARHRPDPDEITKVAIGGLFMIAAPAVLALASMLGGGERVSLGWAVLFELIDNIGQASVYAIAMAMFARAAPRPVAGLAVGFFYLNLMLSNFIVGYVGGWLGSMPDVSFWLAHSAIAGVGTAFLFLIRALFHRRLAPVAVAG